MNNPQCNFHSTEKRVPWIITSRGRRPRRRWAESLATNPAASLSGGRRINRSQRQYASRHRNQRQLRKLIGIGIPGMKYEIEENTYNSKLIRVIINYNIYLVEVEVEWCVQDMETWVVVVVLGLKDCVKGFERKLLSIKATDMVMEAGGWRLELGRINQFLAMDLWS